MIEDDENDFEDVEEESTVAGATGSNDLRIMFNRNNLVTEFTNWRRNPDNNLMIAESGDDEGEDDFEGNSHSGGEGEIGLDDRSSSSSSSSDEPPIIHRARAGLAEDWEDYSSGDEISLMSNDPDDDDEEDR